MDLLNRDLSILKLLVEEKSITKAAQKAGMQQPALSKILKQLENKLERKLFSRTSEGLVPSEFTKDLSRLVDESQTHWQQSLNFILDRESRVEGTFSIACHSILAHAYLSSTFAGLQSQHPLLNLNLTLMTSRLVTEKVVKGEFHFGIVANPVKYPELVTKLLGVDHVYLYTNGHLKKGSVIYYNPEMIDILQFTSKYKDQKLVAVPEYHLILRLLKKEEGQGAILPTCVGSEVRGLKIASKSFYRSEIKLVYREDMHQSFAVKEILSELKKIRLVE